MNAIQRGKMLTIFNGWLDLMTETRGSGTALVFTLKQDGGGSLYLENATVDSMPHKAEWAGATVDDLYAFYTNDPEGSEIDPDVAKKWSEI